MRCANVDDSVDSTPTERPRNVKTLPILRRRSSESSLGLALQSAWGASQGGDRVHEGPCPPCWPEACHPAWGPASSAVQLGSAVHPFVAQCTNRPLGGPTAIQLGSASAGLHSSPVSVPLGQVSIDCDDVHAPPCKRKQSGLHAQSAARDAAGARHSWRTATQWRCRPICESIQACGQQHKHFSSNQPPSSSSAQRKADPHQPTPVSALT